MSNAGQGIIYRLEPSATVAYAGEVWEFKQQLMIKKTFSERKL